MKRFIPGLEQWDQILLSNLGPDGNILFDYGLLFFEFSLRNTISEFGYPEGTTF